MVRQIRHWWEMGLLIITPLSLVQKFLPVTSSQPHPLYHPDPNSDDSQLLTHLLTNKLLTKISSRTCFANLVLQFFPSLNARWCLLTPLNAFYYLTTLLEHANSLSSKSPQPPTLSTPLSSTQPLVPPPLSLARTCDQVTFPLLVGNSPRRSAADVD